MAIEQEELRLSVTLDDQASAQLGNLQAALNNIGQAAGPAQQGLNQLAQSLKGAGGHAGQLHGSLAGLAARGGFIGGFFIELGKGAAKMAQDFAKATLDVKAYADEMVKLEQSANRAATSSAQFQRNVAIFRESGITAGDAAKNIQGFADALGDLQREQSTVRDRLFAGLNPTEFEDMRKFLQRIQTTDRETATNEAKKFGEDIRAYWTSQGQAERGAKAQREFYVILGMPDLDKMRGDLQKVTPELERIYALRKDNAERFQTATEKTADGLEREVRSTQAIAFKVLPITELMEGLASTEEESAKWMESWEESINKANDELQNVAKGEGGFWEWLFQQVGLMGTRTRADELREEGNAPGAPIPLPRPRPKITTERLPLPGGTPQQFMSGGALDADAAGGAGAVLGVGGAVDRLPAEYEEIGRRQIEDRRGDALDARRGATPRGGGPGDPIEDSTTEMEALANELKRLNDFLAPSFFRDGLGPLSTQMGGLGGGLGGGTGIAGRGRAGFGGFGGRGGGYGGGGASGGRGGSSAGPGTGAGAGQTPAGGTPSATPGTPNAPGEMLPAQPGEAAPYRMQGSVEVGGQTFQWASGGGGRGSIPYGTFPVNIATPWGGKGQLGSVGQRIGSVATVGGLGGEINDPRYPNVPREGIQIHPGSGATLDQLNTAGCFGVPRAQWPAFKAKLLEMAAQHPEGISLQIGKNGRAIIGPTSQFVEKGKAGGASAGPSPGAAPVSVPQARSSIVVPLAQAQEIRGEAAADAYTKRLNAMTPEQRQAEFARRDAASGQKVDAAAAIDTAASNRVEVNTKSAFHVRVSAPEGTSVKAEGSGVLANPAVTRAITPAAANAEE